MLLVSVPVLGIIFLSKEWTTKLGVGTVGQFPSPYWGLFFYQDGYWVHKYYNVFNAFPSPYWGLFFIV